MITQNKCKKSEHDWKLIDVKERADIDMGHYLSNKVEIEIYKCAKCGKKKEKIVKDFRK